MLRRYGCKARWISSIAIAACTLTACSSEQKLFKPNERATNLSEAGSFHLAVLSVVPWADFKDKLKPDFELTAQEALSAVLPTTQSIDEKLLDAMSLGLQVGLPSTTFSRTETMTRDVDTRREATTGTSSSIVDTKTQVSGALPSFSEKDATGGRKLSDLPGLATPTIGQDPVLKFQTATSLMQEVALLNSYVENAAIRSSSVPYIVRLQLSALPSMRDQPLDLYANLAFLPGQGQSEEKYLKTPQVLPLLVTDNLNTTQHSRAVDRLRQFALVAGSAAQGVAGQAQLNKIADDLKSVAGSDLNSLFTVGRLGDSGVRVRMGAQAQSNAGYAMISRTHNLTLLVMIPRAYFTKTESVEIAIIGSYELVNGATGKMLSHDYRSAFQRLQKVFELFYCDLPSFSGPASEMPEIRIASEVDRGNWSEFIRKMVDEGNCDSGLAHGLWLYLMNVEQELGLVSASFEVPPPKTNMATVLPPNQTATLLDDGETTAITQLYGGNGLPDSARLEVGERSLPAIAIARQANELQLTFPSLKLWGLDRAGAASRLRLMCKSCLIVKTAPPDWCDAAAEPAFAPDDITKPEKASDGAACYRAVAIVKPTAKAQ